MKKGEEEVTAAPDGMTRFLWWLAAADADILKDCRTEKERYRIIGISVLVTWMFATLAWGYFFSTVVNDDMIVAGLALFFGFAILSVDRTLIAAMSRTNGSIKVMPVIFRLVLAVTIGLFISQPVVLMLFKKDIDAQLELSKQSKLDAYRAQLVKLNAGQMATLQQSLDQGKQQLAQKAAEMKVYKDGYIKETDGTGGSGRIGESDIARVKKSAYLKSEEELETMQRAWEPQQQQLQAQIARMHSADSTKEVVYLGTLTNGFLAQVEALQELTETHPPVKQRYRLIVFIITLIEVMPLLSKILMPKGEYDEKVAAATANGVSAAELETQTGKALQEHYQAAALAADKETVDHLFESTRDIRKEEAETLVRDWRQRENRQYHQLWQQAKKLLLGRIS
ncbi:DUF4407 domain-containing protein [Chitinophaga polysaccharea]|uniref:DUF4407 domain-containing protein n=1 Tax=Chitinophaga TaxID=79328 RepID=UPI0014553017|nr:MULTISPECIES: DUF4407 domain-containing protein [Chitinophaga]NLR57220.1 DUF4407 domain-containing protein [Chitinophaga polysaccharea]NLU91656.1 DUF4407 domain-containing protein [Chitinophaga sp. Ak27]